MINQNTISIEIKITDNLIKSFGIPKYQTDMAAAIDLYACVEKQIILEPNSNAKLISTGIAISIANSNIMGLIAPRSGSGHKKGLILGNTVGIIDADYSGTIFISAWNRNNQSIMINPGERIAQLVFIPIIRANFKIVENFTNSSIRGDKGFGSTGL